MKFETILVVDDEAAMRHMLRLVLEKRGYRVLEAADGEAALEAVSSQSPDAVLCDIRMPGRDGLSFLNEIRRQHPHLTVIMMSAYGTIDTAVECMKQGAYDFVSKPFKTDEVVLCLKKAEERIGLQRENLLLKRRLEDRGEEQFIGASPAVKEIRELIGQVADSALPVLVTGETGTGKEVAARCLYRAGRWREGPFVSVNCGAISSGLMESELFGHAKGAFTGADRAREGLFSAADGGILFLDEIGELPLELQPKLLRVLQEGEVRPVGETRSSKVQVRIVAATARDLHAEVEKGRFRDDLFYRLNVVEIHIPPLRERPEDIPLLAEHFIRRVALQEGRRPPLLKEDAAARLKSFSWPGNVRELLNFIEKTMIFCRGEEIDAASLAPERRGDSRELRDGYDLKEAVRRMEKEYIRKALAATSGNRTLAARLLGISLRALQYKLAEYRLG
ncbi:MAG: sigma-54-dependent Fis family transcriptional regulator [Deltaproteobacteria bacterium]|nr:sigma-54-dependent Fis family transcriptional regulator [Deltaproteobacteria bacterium]